jgi:NAD(P)-dependent dehydrogenase (short-subunit alcohol dehydrogenase family)
MSRLEGKVAIVTGAASGLGRGIAELYAEEGAKVVVSDLLAERGEETVEAIRSAGGEATFVQTDVSSRDSVVALVEAAEAQYGAVHVMTANAGILGRGMDKALVDLPEDEFAETMNVNFWGVLHCFKYAIPAIERAGGGAMTATSSTIGLRGVAKRSAYSASKAAIDALVRTLAAEVSPGIRVNSVAPGSAATDLFRHWVESKGLDPQEFDEAAKGGAKIPHYHPIADRAHGVAAPRDIANAHLFLVSEESAFLTGQTLVVDSGRTVTIRPAAPA